MKDFDAERLTEDLRSREYREAYAAGFLNSWISHQLTILRRQRELTQSQLAERVGTRQPGIARMERDDYGRWSLPTLQRIAFALGCRLKVSFETFGSLIDEVAGFSESALQRPTFEQDAIFFPETAWVPESEEPGPLGEFRRQFVPWLREDTSLDWLAEWLQGTLAAGWRRSLAGAMAPRRAGPRSPVDARPAREVRQARVHQRAVGRHAAWHPERRSGAQSTPARRGVARAGDPR